MLLIADPPDPPAVPVEPPNRLLATCAAISEIALSAVVLGWRRLRRSLGGFEGGVSSALRDAEEQGRARGLRDARMYPAGVVCNG